KTLPSILTIIIALTLSLPVAANIGDWGMVQNFNKKSELAKQGKIQAMYDLGKLYERGRGTNKNMIKAAEWFQKAATAGHAGAQARLGILYFEGRGVNQDYQKAIKLLNAAAKQNVPSAFFQLANMFELGTGVRQDLHQSIYWYERAKQSGYYLAEGKIERLQKRLETGAVTLPSSQTTSKQTNSSSPLIQTVLQGRWLKRKTAVGYLPSNITNCAKDSHNSITCISTSQERSTGTEIITYNTESIVTTNNNKSFDVVYTNNVLDVALLAVEDGNGQTIAPSTSRIKKGKQGKQRKLSCTLKNSKTITCSKGASSFNLVSP
ncbi:MAG: sel1 repeat family protein, partial [Gammaproteobacteria bacterium]|nr:sel1 repeat family protein [Gammaproteobacteria bacterium]